MKAIIAVLIVLFSALAYPESGWIIIAETGKKPNNGLRWEGKPRSLEFSETKGGTPIAVIVGKIFNKKTSYADLYQWYVSAGDCKRGMGKVISLDVSGNFVFENDFVFGSETIATALAETVCGAADRALEKNEKGISSHEWRDIPETQPKNAVEGWQ